MQAHLKAPSAQDTARLRSQVSVPKLLECGDVAHWWCTHIAEVMPTAVIPSAQAAAPLPVAKNDALLDVQADTALGHLSLRDFLAHPESGARGFLVVHKGQIVCEEYPDLRPDQPHLWASCAKPMAGLMIEHLIEAGQLSEQDTLGQHIAALRETDWAEVRVIDVLDMTPGMDCEENEATRSDPRSNAIRAFLAEFNMPYEGRVESLLEVLQSSRKVSEPGRKFEYGSPCTQVLVLLAEAVSGLPWAELFRQQVWAHLRTEGPLQMHLTPDGIPLAHGVVSSTLRDMARFAMLFTPSWDKVAAQPVVSADTLARIRAVARGKAFFQAGYDGPVFTERLGDDTMLGNARQWDCIWPDGDLYKGGFMDQGLYASPERDFVICYFSTTPEMKTTRYLRPLATSGLLG